MKRFALYWLPPLAWMGLTFYLSSQSELPQPPGPWLESVYDKVGHALSYAILALLLWRALAQRYPSSGILAAVCVALAVAYGFSDEFHQAFVPGRTPSVADLAADLFGAAVAMLVLAWHSRRKAQFRTAHGAR